MSSQLTRVLFVCMGNICRSPAGECVLRHLAKQRGIASSLMIDSAGTIGYHVGEPPDARMRQAAAARNIPLTGSSRQFRASDLEVFDVIFAMDRDNYNDIIALALTQEQKNKVSLFCKWVDAFPEEEVPDPYYGGAAGFTRVLDLLENGCNNFLDDFQKL